MPFTLSHAAAILPLHRFGNSHLSLAALTIGSMSPDIPYFVELPFGNDSHSLLGIFYFCWPVGLVLWGIFEYLLKQPTLDLMPGSVRTRFACHTPRVSTRLMLAVSISIMLGALTHVAWDSFTHATSP